MGRIGSTEAIAKQRLVDARLIMNGRVDLRAYPHRHLAVWAGGGFWFGARIRSLLACADLLEQQGWELLSVAAQGRGQVAIMRRPPR
jgi:hypothetical protein